MKKVPGIVFGNLDQYSATPEGSYISELTQDIAAALTANGWPCEMIPPMPAAVISRGLSEPRPPFCLTLNYIPVIEVPVGPGKKQSLYGVMAHNLSIPMICMLIDHPAHLIGAIWAHTNGPDRIGYAVLG
ncbi:MAG: hypothetical protein EXR02_06405 [Rhodospirillales bacterium]|nr:hypothetical protein [Rhodospirillales bacterium]MSP80681.1 hypothetical protein [Rhodospirillales bacterium]